MVTFSGANDEQQVEAPIGRCPAERCVQAATKVIPYPFAAHNPTGHAVTNKGHMPANGLPTDQVVKRRYTVHIGNGKAEQCREIAQVFIRHPSLMPLNDQHRFDTDGLLVWIVSKFRLDLLSFLRSQHGFTLPPCSPVDVGEYVVQTSQDRQEVWNH